MAKTKNKKNAGASDKFHANKVQNKNTKKKINPFEVHINKEKFKVLGKKTKTDRGLPGISRAKALKKRKNTIGFEMKLVNKTNTFLDKRIGEKNNKLTEEEKIMARFAAERIHQHKSKSSKESIYNLADDEMLTHKGHTLEEVEKYDDPRSDDEEEDAFNKKFGNLGDDFVADVNFGGGVLSRNENKDGAMSRKDIIEQLIIDSKKRKIEKQKLKEETLELTEKLDSEWKELHTVVSKTSNKEMKDEPPSLIDKLLTVHDRRGENYDKTMRELKFEPRGTPSDRLKSEDEVAKMDKEKLEKLEADRLARMKGITNTAKANQGYSADALENDFELDFEQDEPITYDAEGKIIWPGSDNKNKQSKTLDDDEKNEDNEEEESGEDEQGGSDNENDEEGEESGADSLDDLRESDTEASGDEESKPETKKRTAIDDNAKPTKKKIVEPTISDEKSKAADELSSKIKEDLLNRKAIMEKAASELPYTYKMPESYEELQEILTKQSPIHQGIIVERIIKCNHPRLGEGNKEKLATLYMYLLQYFNDIFSFDSDSPSLTSEEVLKSFGCYERICPYLYDIAVMDPSHAGNSFLEVIKEKYDDFKSNMKEFPGVDTLIFFKLAHYLFPTSDLKHPVITPCFIMISDILNNAKINSTTDVSKGLFLTNLVLEYTSLSKRFLPAALNFVRNVLFLCVSPVKKMRIKSLPPLKHSSASSNLLVPSLEASGESLTPTEVSKMSAGDLVIEQLNERFKLSCLVTAVKILQQFVERSKENNAQEPLFETHMELLDRISFNNYPEETVSLVKNMISGIENKVTDLVLQPLKEPKKPKMLRLYEPSIENNFTGKKKQPMSKEKAERQKLVYKYKKEMKGALREIRRDKSFISAVKIKEKIKSDDIRKQKVKQIYSEASLQQGELKAFERLKKKKK